MSCIGFGTIQHNNGRYVGLCSCLLILLCLGDITGESGEGSITTQEVSIEEQSGGQSVAKWEENLPVCSLRVLPKDAENFVKAALSKDANFATFFLKFRENVTTETDPRAFLPTIWVWTHNSKNGAFPYLHFHFEAGRLSFGLLHLYSLNVDLHLDNEPSNSSCKLHFGNKSTTAAIAESLGEMVLNYYPKDRPGRNDSVFCHVYKLDPFRNGKAAFYILTYLGLWDDLTAYHCCTLSKEKLNSSIFSEDKLNSSTKCSSKTEFLTDWTQFFYFIGVIGFMYMPLFVFLVCEYFVALNVQRIGPRTGTAEHLQYTDNNYMEESRLLESDVETSEKDVNWMYLGIDQPVTLTGILVKPVEWLRARFPVLMSRLLRLLLFAVILPMPVYVKIVYYKITSSMAVTTRIDAGIPVGFLSIPYGYRVSADNWLTAIGGPYVVFGVYLTIGQICICLPENMTGFLTTVLRRRNPQVNSLLCLDLATVERFGAVDLTVRSGRVFFSNLMKGNLCSILNPAFWMFTFQVFYKRYITCVRDKGALFICVFTVMYIIICTLETILFLIYCGFPSVFFLITMTKAYFYRCRMYPCKHFMYVFILMSLLFNFYAMFLVFIRASIFLLLIVGYTYIGIIVYPNTSLGCVIGVGTTLVYLGSSSRKLRDSYLGILKDIVSVVTEIERNSKDVTISSVRGNAIVLKNVDLTKVEKLEHHGLSVNLTKHQQRVLRLSQMLLGPKQERSRSLYIRWYMRQPGIPAKLYYHVVERHHPLRVSVFTFLAELAAFTVIVVSAVRIVIDFNRTSSLALPAQVVTALVLTLLPKLNEFFTSKMERQVKKERRKNELECIVKQFYFSNDTINSAKILRLRSLV